MPLRTLPSQSYGCTWVIASQYIRLCGTTCSHVCMLPRAVFGDLCTYMNLPLLTTNVNVYCDGVYDLCHIGHKNLFKSALKFGTRLYVGVVGDKDAMNYKRPPIMSMEERAAEVCWVCAYMDVRS